MKRKAYINPPPAAELHKGAPSDAVHADFAARLQRALIAKGWNQSDLARRAADHLPEGNRIARDNISGYIRGKALPGPVNLDAMAKALGVAPDELLPPRSSPSVIANHPPLDARDLGDGNVWLRVNQAVPWPVAIKVLGLLKSPVPEQET